LTSILNYQGQSLILNIFFGPVVNAAKAIADKINSVVSSFSNNFYMAVRPQIIKSFSSGNKDYMFQLVYRSTKFSFYLLFLIAMPLIFLMKKILIIWLGVEQVNQDMVIFSQLCLVFSLVNVFEQPITVMIQATGKIKNYQLIIGFFTLLLIPICFVAFKMGAPAYYSLIILISIYSIAQIFRLIIAKKQLGLSITFYCRNIFLPILISIFPSIFFSYFICLFFSDNLIELILAGILCLLISIFFIFYLGINKKEREVIVSYLQNKILKRT
jgi:O-antigen/teichoic acid export membrane protein